MNNCRATSMGGFKVTPQKWSVDALTLNGRKIKNFGLINTGN